MASIADNTTARVGAAVKRLRSERGWSTRELAARSGVSAAMISEAERGAKSPTITILSALAAALEVPLSRLVDDAPAVPRVLVVRAADHRAVVDANGVRRASLGPMLPDSPVEFVQLALPPRSSVRFLPHPAGSIERVHIASGHVDVLIGEVTNELVAGDTIVFAGDVEHGFANRGRSEAVVFLVIDHGRGAGMTVPVHG